MAIMDGWIVYRGLIKGKDEAEKIGNYTKKYTSEFINFTNKSARSPKMSLAP